jgi:hypothetical protein
MERLSCIDLDGPRFSAMNPASTLPVSSHAFSLGIRARMILALALSAVCTLSGCQTVPAREQQIKRATKQVLAVPFSQRGQLIHQLAKQGELPIDVANTWITEWNERTSKIAKAEKEHARQHALVLRRQRSPATAQQRMTPAQLTKLINAHDKSLRDLQATIDNIESYRPSSRRERQTVYQPSSPRQRSLTITPTGNNGSFYASDPSVPNSIQYYQKIGDTYYWSE